MTRLEDCCTACFTQGCAAVVCLDADPAALCDDCGSVTCGDHDCPPDVCEVSA